jgi:hypothetical protein
MTGELGVYLLGSAPQHGLSAKAVEIGRVFNFPVTNSHGRQFGCSLLV